MMRGTVNAGHCPGIDSGAIGSSGLQEADVARFVAQKVISYLQNVGHEMQFIQEDELDLICSRSNNFSSDYFISIHCNSAVNPSAHGTEIFTTLGETAADSLATCVMDQFSQAFPAITVRADYSDGDVDKEAGFYVIKHTDAPAILFEIAFISNPEEERFLADRVQLDQVAAAIARGVTDWECL